jgi:phosphate transport system permease protein
LKIKGSKLCRSITQTPEQMCCGRLWKDLKTFMKNKANLLETVVHGIFLILGLITVGCVLLITAYLIVSGVPAITQIGLFKFLFGTKWASTAAEPSFGILPFILTSVYGTGGAILIGVPIGFFTAVYLAKIAPAKVRAVIETAVSLLAGIPSVVYGLVGMLVLVPGIRSLFHVPDGASLLAAIIVLAIMILPSIIKVSLTALEAVPKEYEDASLALGATDIETYFKVSVPAAKSGIAAAVVLGVGRAIGEAMAVMMVSGNVPNMPSLFQSVRFLTTAVASEMSYSAGLQRQALFSIALVLFLFIMLINATLNFFLKHEKA